MKSASSILIVALNTVILIAVVELASYGVLRLYGIDSPLFIDKNMEVKVRGSTREESRIIDPHLGYAHGADEPGVKKITKQFVWRDGFVIYAKEIKDIQHPVILALGGSTTDGVKYGHSWPEELSKLLIKNGVSGTVINGGVGGYSTSQDLIKLVRDGLEFKPDIVISYSGINDRGEYGELPYPMVHTYQRELFKSIVDTNSSRPKYMVSTITLLKNMTNTQSASDLNFTFGVESQGSYAEQYTRNIELMHAISTSQGADFFAFIQPVAFYNSIHNSSEISKGEGYKNMVLDLYDQIAVLPDRLEFVYDATQILEQDSDVYKEDGVHLTENGDKVVANYIFRQIEPVLRTLQ
jgi:lysophospholipase L1-like esterase